MMVSVFILMSLLDCNIAFLHPCQFQSFSDPSSLPREIYKKKNHRAVKPVVHKYSSIIKEAKIQRAKIGQKPHDTAAFRGNQWAGFLPLAGHLEPAKVSSCATSQNLGGE